MGEAVRVPDGLAAEEVVHHGHVHDVEGDQEAVDHGQGLQQAGEVTRRLLVLGREKVSFNTLGGYVMR